MFFFLNLNANVGKTFKCKRLGKHIVKNEGHMSSERQEGMATARADLDHHDVSLSRRDDKSSDILHDRQRVVSKREMVKPDT